MGGLKFKYFVNMEVMGWWKNSNGLEGLGAGYMPDSAYAPQELTNFSKPLKFALSYVPILSRS